ncbi:response regulator transcription factor [Sphingomonas sp. C3-2]|uniref:response regulator transcription factor n=1 Tax=Sphingomonas sp. C3-2 TaxID=3062169 RepID=UPI00294B1949|nr:response regulator transcription factor [Sphingomonas sp. C3-2]WOK35481.1 response regulator transcription factor [Sphingomonas sp. C3-2]
MTAAWPRRIGVLEDSAPVRDYFIEIIETADDLELCGVATSLTEMGALIAQRPDLVLTDLGLPDGNGLTIIPTLKQAGILSLVITAFGDRDTVVSALSAGADGYLLKDAAAEAIIDGIRVTLDGGAPISAAAAVFLLERLRAAEPAAADPAGGEQLTPREAELLALFARGYSYKSAARELGISPLTVGGYVKAIYRKLEVNSRGEAVYAAVQRGQLNL